MTDRKVRQPFSANYTLHVHVLNMEWLRNKGETDELTGEHCSFCDQILMAIEWHVSQKIFFAFI
jgi:hypothetical protein